MPFRSFVATRCSSALVACILLLSFCAFAASTAPPSAASPAPALLLSTDFIATKVFSGSNIIWGLDFLSENEALFTEKSGTVSLLDLKTGTRRNVSGGPTPVINGQGGLLDLKTLREGAGSSEKVWVYFTSSVAPEKGEPGLRARTQTTALFRGILKKSTTTVSIEGLTRLFEAEPGVDSAFHFGSRLAFPKAGGVFMSVGERNERERAQDLTQHWGKVLHLTLDGKPFATNPFAKQTKIGGVLPRAEIYSFGHRNPQGLAIDPKTGQLFESEHGPKGGDEINQIEAGKNYGWPVITYGREYTGPAIGTFVQVGFEQPLKYYVPSIAPSSLLIYSGKKHKELEGKFLLGALVLKHLNITDIKTGAELRLFKKLGERIRNVVESPAGEIYFSTDSGMIFRLDRKKTL
ncbi:PQQ-dependent sugar dehydrogenase [soil metagenome]